MSKVTDTYTNDDGETITKVEDVNGVVLVESFLNSDENLEYSTYTPEDGGVVNMDTTDLDDDSIILKQKETLETLLCGTFNVNCKEGK